MSSKFDIDGLESAVCRDISCSYQFGQSDLVIRDVEVLAWHCQRDEPQRPLAALCGTTAEYEGEVWWVIAQMARIDEWWHAITATDNGGYWLHVYCEAPSVAEVARDAKLVGLKPSLGTVGHEVHLSADAWRRFTGEVPDVETLSSTHIRQ